MIRIQQMKLKIPHTNRQLREKICKLLRVGEEAVVSCEITRRSLDARKKPELFYVYTVDVELKQESAARKKIKDKNILFIEKEAPYRAVPTGKQHLRFRPAVIGTGPAGLFCGYQLAKLGYRPILLERGANVRERIRDVEQFFQGGPLKKDSNVQFGEGGAGTFSDGKLNTLVHDNCGRNREVLRLFHMFGAPEQILYDSKPHIGTDILCNIVERLREEIKKLGGEVWFHSQVTDMKYSTASDGTKSLSALHVRDTETGESSLLQTELAVLAVGHSARDTFEMLERLGIEMQAKSFAVGVRVEHPQKFINESQYGKEYDPSLPAAPYKLTAKAQDGRGVYTFCMCPGGYVVNASSEPGRLAVNGMSYSGRDGSNANSAIIVSVTPEDYGGNFPADSLADPLAGVEFQRRLEERAYQLGQGAVPVQRYGLFKACVERGCSQEELGAGQGADLEQFLQDCQSQSLQPCIKGKWQESDLSGLLPGELSRAFVEGMEQFGRQIPGFDRPDAILSGVESRTSSPVRILRDEELQSRIQGIYPCGEGAGYAGGITSAAMDVIKVAEAIAAVYKPL